ncbi:breast cancer protein [Xylariomycetidae sp. FL0641]|nr:breast cancer protein [Xylariomycetidae sp. FL0641]
MRSWFKGSSSKAGASASAKTSPAPSQVDLRAREIAQLEQAMVCASMIMNDDIDGAEKGMQEGDSTFHALGNGLCIFMRSILGFEKSIMVEASNRLIECENTAWNELKKAQKEGTNSAEKIYPPGSEYALVLAEAQLMSAIVAVLHESLTEGIKGFYKCRKAFITLDGLMQSETAYLQRKGLQPGDSKEPTTLAPPPPSAADLAPGTPDEDKDLEFVDADESHSGAQTPLNYEGHLAKEAGAEKKMAELSLDPEKASPTGTEKNVPAPSGFESGPDSDVFTDPIDIFVHSGTNMCFGVLLLMISMVPPAFSRLLSIIGFKGDRERGVSMLWQSSRFDNVNGAVAGLMILAYYNGLLGFADILPSDEDVERGAIMGYPKAKCEALLKNMRARYPDSGLWRLEEARVAANSKELHAAIEILKTNTASRMRQVNALNIFELSLNSMYVGDHDGMRDNFVRCVELNDWSHALYYYLAGCGELELYRAAVHAAEPDAARVARHKQKAEELFRKAPTVAGKKRLLAKPLPFEQFATRKVQKWEERAKALGLGSLVDAVGVSPTQEMVYLWNGIKKMQAPELARAETALAWDRLTAPPEAAAKIRAETDEKAVRDVCAAAIARALGRFDEARGILDEVVAIDRLAFKGPTKDDYALPAAHYETAVLAWASLKLDAGDEAAMKAKLDECEACLDRVARWEAYVLDARIGMRVQTGLDTIRWYKREHAWAR